MGRGVKGIGSMKCYIFCSVIFQSKKHILRAYSVVQYQERIFSKLMQYAAHFFLKVKYCTDMCRKCLLRYCK